MSPSGLNKGWPTYSKRGLREQKQGFRFLIMNVVLLLLIIVISLMVLIFVSKNCIWHSSSSKSKKNTTKTVSPPRIRHRYEPVDHFGTGDLKTEIHMKWSRPVRTLPVHVDVPRLARKMAIYGDNTRNNILHAAKDTEEVSKTMDAQTQDQYIIRDIILTLSIHLGEPREQQKHIESKFNEFFGPGDTSVALREYMEQVVGDGSKVIAVLKACNQSILAPGVLKLKFSVGNQFPFKDMRGSWRIDIIVDTDKVTVIHSKRERSFEDNPSDYFEFGWSLAMVFDKEVSDLLETLLFIEDISYGCDVQNDKKVKIRESMKSFIRQ